MGDLLVGPWYRGVEQQGLEALKAEGVIVDLTQAQQEASPRVGERAPPLTDGEGDVVVGRLLSEDRHKGVGGGTANGDLMAGCPLLQHPPDGPQRRADLLQMVGVDRKRSQQSLPRGPHFDIGRAPYLIEQGFAVRDGIAVEDEVPHGGIPIGREACPDPAWLEELVLLYEARVLTVEEEEIGLQRAIEAVDQLAVVDDELEGRQHGGDGSLKALERLGVAGIDQPGEWYSPFNELVDKELADEGVGRRLGQRVGEKAGAEGIEGDGSVPEDRALLRVERVVCER